MQYKVCHFIVKYENDIIQKLVHKYIFDTTRKYIYCKTQDRKTKQKYVNETTTQNHTSLETGLNLRLRKGFKARTYRITQ